MINFTECTQTNTPDDATYDVHHHVVVSTNPEPNDPIAPFASFAKKDDHHIDISPLLHPLAIRTLNTVYEVVKYIFPSMGGLLPLPSTYCADTGDWRLGRNHKGTADFVALYALGNTTVSLFAFDAKQRETWIDMTYGKSATWFNGKSDATQLIFVKKTREMFDANLQFAQKVPLVVGDVLICHTAMAWKVQGAAVHCIHFALNADPNAHRVSWSKAWEQKGYIDPALDFGGLCQQFRISNLPVQETPLLELPNIPYEHPPWLKESDPLEAFEKARNYLLEQNFAAWNPEWETTTRSHAPHTKQFKIGLKKMMERIEVMTKRLPLLTQEQAALKSVRDSLDSVPQSAREGNVLKSWKRLDRLYHQESDKLLTWIYDGKTKGSDLLEDTKSFLAKFAVRIQMVPFAFSKEKKEVMVPITEAKAIFVEMGHLLKMAGDKVTDATLRASIIPISNAYKDLAKSTTLHRDNTAYMYDVSACLQGIEYLRNIDSIVVVNKPVVASDEDEEEEEDYEEESDEECGPFRSMVPTFFSREEAFKTSKKRGTCSECEATGMIYASSEACNTCTVRIIQKAGNVCNSNACNMPNEDAKKMCLDIKTKLLSIASALETGAESDIVNYSRAIFTDIDKLKASVGKDFDLHDEHYDQEDMDEDDSLVVSDDEEIEEEVSSSSEESYKSNKKKRAREEEGDMGLAHDMVMAMVHTPVASVLKPTIHAYRDKNYDAIRGALKMLKSLPVLYAIVDAHGDYKEMFLTEEDAQNNCRGEQKVQVIKQNE